ncbi:MAG: DMT family transporter [Gammaproteobacteria bacterium]|nr:DMT family transporter [Gammaproteobacteria bacterium]MBU1654507.1 DMT family transporter [Gammaproteobacteria bacterium]MBU1961325.1 DMT family transporter [Gammaproteobacteria bacterium]
MGQHRLAIGHALLAALLFGAATPLIKLLLGDLSALLLAGLLYLGSGLGLAVQRLLRDGGWRPSGMPPADWPWFLGAILFGGVLAPVLLVWGLARTGAGSTSLLLNLEAVLTASLAWVVFREHADRRIVIGMALIVAGGLSLSWPTEDGGVSAWWGMAAIAAACLCWAIDNNLTRKVSASDALFIAGIKGLTAGAVNLGSALALGRTSPSVIDVGMTMLVGWLGYGVSLVLFVRALRELGTSRTGAYFSIAPFAGAALSILLLDESTSLSFWLAAVLMAAGVWLHLTEHHAHEHEHEALNHSHSHSHNLHHRHAHDFPWDGREPHDHPHEHLPMRHYHPHYPDIHHRHGH